MVCKLSRASQPQYVSHASKHAQAEEGMSCMPGMSVHVVQCELMLSTVLNPPNRAYQVQCKAWMTAHAG